MGNWIVDQAHSTVGFQVKHMMISRVRGYFDSFTELPERESPLLQLWDESEVKPGVSSDTLMV